MRKRWRIQPSRLVDEGTKFWRIGHDRSVRAASVTRSIHLFLTPATLQEIERFREKQRSQTPSSGRNDPARRVSRHAETPIVLCFLQVVIALRESHIFCSSASHYQESRLTTSSPFDLHPQPLSLPSQRVHVRRSSLYCCIRSTSLPCALRLRSPARV